LKKWLITLCLIPLLVACTNNETEVQYDNQTNLGVTAAAFELVESGMTSDDVVAIIGAEIERRDVEGELEHIVWDIFDGGLQSISAIFDEDGYINSLFQFGLSIEGEDPVCLQEAYEQLSVGMTYEDVRMMMGTLPSNLFFGRWKVATWMGTNEDDIFQSITVRFDNGIADDISFFSSD